MRLHYRDEFGNAHEVEGTDVEVVGTGGHIRLGGVENVEVVNARWVTVSRSEHVNVDSCSAVVTSASIIDGHNGIVTPHGTRVEPPPSPPSPASWAR